jgi:protein TonB
MPDRRLAMAALGLGIAGLFTGGLLGCGSLLGLVLAVTALGLRAKAPDRYGGRDLAWAAVAANVFALLSLLPLAMLGVTLWPMAQQAYNGSYFDDTLPEPASPGPEVLPYSAAPPPPPPPPPLPSPSVTADEVEPEPEPQPTPRTTRSTPPPTPEPTEEAAADEDPVPSGPVRVGGRIREPTKVKNVVPVYPQIARQARVQGVVILEVTIGPRGTVTDVKLLRGIPLLDHAAIEAVKQWEYTPTLLDGRPVPVIMVVTVNFRLS